MGLTAKSSQIKPSIINNLIIDTARIVCGAESVHLTVPQFARAAGLLLSAMPAGDID